MRSLLLHFAAVALLFSGASCATTSVREGLDTLFGAAFAAQQFHAEAGRWPGSEAELSAYAQDYGLSVDRIRLKPLEDGDLYLEWRQGNWLSGIGVVSMNLPPPAPVRQSDHWRPGRASDRVRHAAAAVVEGSGKTDRR